MRTWLKSGTPWIWLTAASVSISLIMVVGLITLIAFRGLGHFWPSDVANYYYTERDGSTTLIVGELRDQEEVSAERIRDSGISLDDQSSYVTRYLIKEGNRDITGSDFRWIIEPNIAKTSLPEDIAVLERREWGNLYGHVKELKINDEIVAKDDNAWVPLLAEIESNLATQAEIREIEKNHIGAINYSMERLRLKTRSLQLKGEDTPANLEEIEKQQKSLDHEYNSLQKQLGSLYSEIDRSSVSVAVSNGTVVNIKISNIIRAYQPNQLNFSDKLDFYLDKIWEFLADDPREANTEGGIFPAIFGTVMMVLLMSLMVTPFGVIAAIYLHEYAKQGPVTRTIRIAVNNLAGVPSIVYGVFGLGFFVYFLGGSLDALFYPEAHPAPTFGTPGLLWASITLALLTVPVVIVSTEEGLSRIPRSIREGSLALGATQLETLWRTIIPMASPAIMTGVILAIARAAGEVAPLMLVGVVKLAPSLPLDGNFPYVHLERKFMHLGFHIYDVGFQSPNVEAARPLVYATALLLILVIIALNLTAIAIRNRLREKYKALEE